MPLNRDGSYTLDKEPNIFDKDLNKFEKAEDILLSAKALIYKNEKVLILKDAYSDWWDLPGGHIQDEETVEEGLTREVKEETGLDIRNPIEMMAKEMKLGNEEKVVIFYECSATGEIKLSDEHTGYEWISPQDTDKWNLGVFAEIIESSEDFLNKAWEKAGKVLVERQVSRAGKTWTQKFWVEPAKAKAEGLTPLEEPKPTYAPARGRGRPTTAENVMDLPHTVKPAEKSRFGDTPVRWSEYANFAVKIEAGAVNEGRIRDSELVGNQAFAKLARGSDGFVIDTGGTIQGVVAFNISEGTLEIDNLAAAPWNFSGSPDKRKVEGVGVRLLTEIFGKVMDEGIQNVKLESYGNAIKFYEAVGFKPTEPGSRMMTIDRAGIEKFLRKFQ